MDEHSANGSASAFDSRRWYRNHPEVKFVPGPFYMGDGFIGWFANLNCIFWTLFVCVVFALPTVLPVTGETMNYAAVRGLSAYHHLMQV